MWLRARRVLLVGAAAWLAFGCAQTDVIATGGSPLCLHAGDCAGNGHCEAHACVGTAAIGASCAAQVPAIVAGDGCSDAQPSQPAFRFGVCACTDLVSSSPVSLDAWDSRGGSATATDAALGVNGNLDVHAALTVNGSVQLTSDYVLGASPQVQIGGAVFAPANPPCNCAPANRLDFSALAAAAASANDDAAQGLDPTAFDGLSASRSVTLPCGRYYFTQLASSADVELLVQGRVQVLIAGNVELDHSLSVHLGAGASLDLLVVGTVRVSGDLQLGSQADAARVRSYVGGSGTIDLGGTSTLAGVLYAPQAELVTRGPLTSYGALLVRRAALGGALQVHYDVALAQPGSCTALTGP